MRKGDADNMKAGRETASAKRVTASPRAPAARRRSPSAVRSDVSADRTAVTAEDAALIALFRERIWSELGLAANTLVSYQLDLEGLSRWLGSRGATLATCT